MLINSKTVMTYKKVYGSEWVKNREKFLKMLEGKSKPYRVEFYFIRDSKRKFDYINALQLPCDLMQECGWIEDDNCENLIPVIKGYEVDKANAGVEIRVL